MIRKCFCLLVVMSLLSSLIACSGKSEKEEAIDTTTVVTTKTEQTTKAVQTTSATQQTAESTTAEPENPFKEKMVLNFLTGQESAEFYVEGRWDELELEERSMSILSYGISESSPGQTINDHDVGCGDVRIGVSIIIQAKNVSGRIIPIRTVR